MAKNLRASQLETSQIVVSGSSGTNAQLVVYPESKENQSSPHQGLIDNSAFNTSSIGNDVFLYVSGAKGAKDAATNGVSAFGGDLVVSGTLHGAAGKFTSGLTGALNLISTGVPNLLAGAGITLTTASNGQVTVAGTDASVAAYWTSTTNQQAFTSGSIAVTGSGLFKSGLTGALNVLPNNSASIVPGNQSITIATSSWGQIAISASNTFIPIAGHVTSSNVEATPTILGSIYFDPNEVAEKDYHIRTVMRSAATVSGVLQVYNVTSGCYVDLRGVGQKKINAVGAYSDCYESDNLSGSGGFYTSIPAIYEARLYSQATSTVVTASNTQLVCGEQKFYSLHDSLPSWVAFARAAGPYSYQTAAALSGTVFITTGSTVNLPRFHWVPALSASALIIEPARTNILGSSSFVDANSNNVPDGWTAEGSAGTDFQIIGNGAPYGGSCLQINDSGPAAKGAWIAQAGAATAYVYSCIMSASITSSYNSYTFSGGGDYFVTVPAGPFEWTTISKVQTPAGSLTHAYIQTKTDPTGIVKIAQPQIEAGSYASTWIPTTTAAQTRPAETVTIAANKMPLTAGTIEFDWIPGFDSTATLEEITSGVPVLFGWADSTANYSNGSLLMLYGNIGDRKLYIVNNGNTRAISAALPSFTAWNSVFHIKMEFGIFGSRLTVNGATTTDATAWEAPSTGLGYLGSNAAGAQIASAGYANLKITGR